MIRGDTRRVGSSHVIARESPSLPLDEAELLRRAGALAGRTLGELAAIQGRSIPADPLRAKGIVGQLIERELGLAPSSQSGPDFGALGIELKTLPLNGRGHPRESTFVTTLDLEDPAAFRWDTSPVRAKLARVLWVPVEADLAIPLSRRRVRSPLLWSPTLSQAASLRDDFELLTELLAEGFGDRVSARVGRWLQLRPKGRNRAHLRWALDPEGARVRAPGRAFYLRARFTALLLAGG
jgi:DNA mismatch repair protein MutH